MKITILCVGKVKEKFYRDAIDEFSKRLSRYCKLEIVEVSDEKTEEQASENEIRLIKAKEGERILKNIKDDAHVIALCIDGKQLDSEELSQKEEKKNDVAKESEETSEKENTEKLAKKIKQEKSEEKITDNKKENVANNNDNGIIIDDEITPLLDVPQTGDKGMNNWILLLLGSMSMYVSVLYAYNKKMCAKKKVAKI